MSEGSEIWGQRWRILLRDDGPEGLATMTKALAEEDEPKFLMTTTEVSIEEAEDKTRPSERLRRWRCRCVYGISVLKTTMAALEE